MKCEPARFSPCGRYRYTLHRPIELGFFKNLGTVLFVMLNPSTATDTEDDPTIRRCMGFAVAWGYGDLLVGNLFALRSTDPAGLAAVEDPVGPDNDRALAEMAARADTIVCAWGAHDGAEARAAVVLPLLRASGKPIKALRLTRAGAPGHPLYVPRDVKPIDL